MIISISISISDDGAVVFGLDPLHQIVNADAGAGASAATTPLAPPSGIHHTPPPAPARAHVENMTGAGLCAT